MARSKRHTPIAGYRPSAKKEKCAFNRVLRRLVRYALRAESEPEVLPELGETSSDRDMSKEPRHWFNSNDVPRLMRK